MQRATKRRVREPHAVQFGKKLKEARSSAKLTQGQLAIRLGVSSKMVSHYEQGESEMPLHMMPRLLEALGRGFSYFFPDMRAVVGTTTSPADEEWLSYLGRRAETVPPGEVREGYKDILREFADRQADYVRRIVEKEPAK